MVVGFVNSGIMKTPPQAIGIITGCHVCNTIIFWIVSLSVFEGDSLVTKAFKAVVFILVFAFVGIILLMFCIFAK